MVCLGHDVREKFEGLTVVLRTLLRSVSEWRVVAQLSILVARETMHAMQEEAAEMREKRALQRNARCIFKFCADDVEQGDCATHSALDRVGGGRMSCREKD